MRVLVRNVYAQRLIALILPFLIIVACGASAREKVVQTTFHSLSAASDGFAIWDQTHQTEIVTLATTFESGQRDLFAYWEKREKVMTAFAAAYQAVALAAMEDKAVNVGLVLERAKELFELIKTLTGKDPRKEVL